MSPADPAAASWGRATAWVVSLAFALILLRVAQLQLLPGRRLVEFMHAGESRASVPALRGDILDRRGRPLATTCFAHRAFVDPTEFPSPPDEAIVELAEALGADAGEIGEAVVQAIEANVIREKVRAIALASRAARGGSIPVACPTDACVALGWLQAADEFAPLDPIIRYVRVSGNLEPEVASALRQKRIPGVHLEQRSVRAYPDEELVGPIVGRVDVDHAGRVGAEKILNARLVGTPGGLRYIRDASGRPLWIEPGAYLPPERGGDVRLAIDSEIQRMAEEELTRGVEEADAAGGRMVIMDPRTGEVLAMAAINRDIPEAADYPWADALGQARGGPIPPRRYRTRAVHSEAPSFVHNRCVEDVYEPGSTFKPVVWSLITDLGRARQDEVFDTEGGRWRTPYGRPIVDVTQRATMTWPEVLMNSSNIGMSKAVERITPDECRNGLLRFGFGARTGIGLPGESAGMVQTRAKWRRDTHTSVSFGHEVAVTPLQLARAFSALAAGGDRGGVLPPVTIQLPDPGEERGVFRRVVSPETARLVRAALVGVVTTLDSRLALRDPPEQGWRYSMFGKSGTPEIPLHDPPPGKRRPRGSSGYFEGQYNSNFIGAGPVNDPRLVILVIIEDPGPSLIARKLHYGASTAGPVVRRAMDRSLAYLGVPPDMPDESQSHPASQLASKPTRQLPGAD